MDLKRFAESFSAFGLAAIGQFEATWPRRRGALQLARKSDTFNFATNSFAMSAWLAGGTDGTDLPDLLQLSVECLDSANPDNQSASLHAPLYLGAAHFLSGNFADADAAFTAALPRMHDAGTALEWHCNYVAVHADNCRALQNIDRAIAIARQGIEFADKGGFRFQAAACRAALADALVFAGAPVAEVQAVIDETRVLVEATGGLSLMPRQRETEIRLAACVHPHQLEPGLREAESMYREMGALGHADRLLTEVTGLSGTRLPGVPRLFILFFN